MRSCGNDKWRRKMLDSLPSENVDTIERASVPKEVEEVKLDKLTPEKVDAVIKRIEEGESERSACRSENVSRSSFRSMALRQQAGDQYARALYGLAHDQVDRMEEILQKLEDGQVDPQTARVLVDTR